MKRKIVRQGGSALTITLPSKWARKYELDSGDEVEVEERGKELVIRTGKDFSCSVAEFDATKFDRFYYNFISYLYHRGYDEVKVTYDNPSVLKTAQQKISDLMGFEIIETGKNYFVIKNVAMALESEFDVILRRVFLMLKSMGPDILESIKAGNYAHLEEIKLIEKTNDKFTDFCIRILNKKGYHDFQKTAFIYSIARNLEKIGDCYAEICSELSKKPKNFRISSDALSFFSDINDYFSLFYESFYKFDSSRISPIFEKSKSLVDRGQKLLDKSKNEKMLIYQLNLIVLNIFDMKGPFICMNI